MAIGASVGLNDPVTAHTHPMGTGEVLPVGPHPSAELANRFEEGPVRFAATGQSPDLQRVVEPDSDPTSQKPRIPRLQKLSSNREPRVQQSPIPSIVCRTRGAQHVADELVLVPTAADKDVG